MRRFGFSLLIALACVAGSAAAAPARDLVLVTNAAGSDVRSIEQTGALVNYVRPDGVVAEASATEQTSLAGMGFSVKVLTPNVTAVYQANGTDGRYLTYAQFRDTMAIIALNNPDICKLETLGTSYSGNLLLAMKVSANPLVHDNEPAVHFEGGIHGDEKIGWAVAFEMLKYVVSNYGSDTLVTRLVNSRELWFHPMYNPDGNIDGSRYNGNGVDLNRNWGWMWGDPGSPCGTNPYSEPENRAVLAHIMRHAFTMFVSYHAGTEMISYPWSCTPYGSVPDSIPERHLMDFLSSKYSQPSGYEYGQGAIVMYSINGSTKDFDYGQGMMAWSIELHYTKTPPAESIQPTFDRNRAAILEFFHRAGQGINGTVTDARNGQPVHCQIWVGPANWPSYNDPTLGDFHRFCLPGTYDVTFRSPGYRDTTLADVVVPNSGDSATTVDIQMTPDATAPLFGYRVIYCDGDSSYTANPSIDIALGGHDGVPYPLTTGRRLCIDMERTVHNVAGADLTVYRPSGSGTATVKGSDSYLGPWTTIGTANAAQSTFDISSSGLDSVRYVELTSSGTFNVDAIEGANDYVGLSEAQFPVSSYQFPILRASNPASGSIRFALSTPPPPGTRLVIRDATGRLVRSCPVSTLSFVLSTPDLSSGVYFASLEPDGSAPLRVVLTR
ncbi:MAG: M14 family zinc carboxypeptidase [candidate division WOR-3 bacterium]|nr:M14 family zinc carboxypeptidase [candidate division WOR-3 bacterium]